MIYRLHTTTIGGRTYVTGYNLISERGTPEADNELPGALMETAPDGSRKLAELRDENGKLRWAIEDNPDHGKQIAPDRVDTRRKIIVERRQALTPEELEAKAQRERRERVAAALPDLLLAAADGKDIGAEVRKVLDEGGIT